MIASLVDRARGDGGDRGAACLAALMRGEDSVEADAGSYLLADAIYKFMKTPIQK